LVVNAPVPGTRLNARERERIAEALAEGFGYTEIARELGRPTSTVSREVARNGGPAGYRADRAQRATAQRARRPRAASVEPEHETGAVRRFGERFAAALEQTGVPRMVARVLGALLVADSDTLTSAELVERLRVSPASVSKAVGQLAELDVVRRERIPPGRRERYRIDDDAWLRSWTTSARTHEVLADLAREGAGLLGRDTRAGARLAGIDGFFRRLVEDMTGGLGAAALDDALTVLAALVHTGVPLRPADLAGALGWPVARVCAAVRDAEQRPDVTDPVAVREVGSGLLTAGPVAGRLADVQRAALGRASGRGGTPDSPRAGR
jgi:hypothetical protein